MSAIQDLVNSFYNYKPQTAETQPAKPVESKIPTLLTGISPYLNTEPKQAQVPKKATVKPVQTQAITTQATDQNLSPEQKLATQIMNKYGNTIEIASKKYGISVPILMSVIMQESSGNPNAISKTGAIGLMQVEPETAKEMGIDPKNLKDPKTNIMAGAKYLAKMLKQYNGDMSKALLAYNGSLDSGSKIQTESTNAQNDPLMQYLETNALNQTKQLAQTPEQIEQFQAQNQKLMEKLMNSNTEFQKVLGKVSEQMNKLNDPPSVKTYQDVVQQNQKLTPILLGILMLGHALFGNHASVGFASDLNAMYEGLNQKNLQDYAIAQEDFKNKLTEWKTKTQFALDKINEGLNLAIQGKNANDALLQSGIQMNVNNINTLLALNKELNTAIESIAKIKNDMVKNSIAAINANARQQSAASYSQSVLDKAKLIGSTIGYNQAKKLNVLSKTNTGGEFTDGNTGVNPTKTNAKQTGMATPIIHVDVSK